MDFVWYVPPLAIKTKLFCLTTQIFHFSKIGFSLPYFIIFISFV